MFIVLLQVIARDGLPGANYLWERIPGGGALSGQPAYLGVVGPLRLLWWKCLEVGMIHEQMIWVYSPNPVKYL